TSLKIIPFAGINSERKPISPASFNSISASPNLLSPFLSVYTLVILNILLIQLFFQSLPVPVRQSSTGFIRAIQKFSKHPGRVIALLYCLIRENKFVKGVVIISIFWFYGNFLVTFGFGI